MKKMTLLSKKKESIITFLILFLSILLFSSFIQNVKINAKATPVSELSNFAIDCNQVVDVFGKAETVLNVNTEGRYRLWAKIRSENPGADSFFVRVDGACFVFGNNTDTTSWSWVDYVSGSNDRKFDLDVTAGPLKIEFFAREKGVQLDKIQLIGDTARCENAYRSGSNCEEPVLQEDTIIEDVNITGLVEGAKLHTATVIQAEPHPSLEVNNITFYINDKSVRIDGTAPYCMQGAKAENCKAYDFTTLSEGSHTLSVEVSTFNAGTFVKDINFSYANIMHSGTAIDIDAPTEAEETPEVDITNEQDVFVEESEPNPEQPADFEPAREITASLNNTDAQFENDQALITDTASPTLTIDNVQNTNSLLLNGNTIPVTTTIQFTETGRNVLSVLNQNGLVLKEYVVVIRYPDFDGDNKIGSSDLRKIILNWRTANDRYDLNGDGIINSLDIRILINKWSELQ